MIIPPIVIYKILCPSNPVHLHRMPLLVRTYFFTHKVSMEVVWNLEYKWKLTTQEAFFMLVCTGLAVIALCAATVLKKRVRQKHRADDQERVTRDGLRNANWGKPSCDFVSIKRMLMSKMRWSRASKWDEKSSRSWREQKPPLLGQEENDRSPGWQSCNLNSPVWQRPILMGEKCELPRFSGLFCMMTWADHLTTLSRKIIIRWLDLTSSYIPYLLTVFHFQEFSITNKLFSPFFLVLFWRKNQLLLRELPSGTCCDISIIFCNKADDISSRVLVSPCLNSSS